jgi:hypothetical protein
MSFLVILREMRCEKPRNGHALSVACTGHAGHSYWSLPHFKAIFACD